MRYFTADPHFGHTNIIKFCNRINPETGRKFNNVDEMDSFIIKQFNSVVSKTDTLYILGDFSYRDVHSYANKLNGNLILIRGNHDFRFKYNQLKQYFSEVYDSVEIKATNPETNKKLGIYLNHYACRTWPGSHRGNWHLFGHSHGNLEPFGRSFDIGVDCHNYTPLNLEQISKIIKKLESNANQINQ